jgi:hypothetical protein
MEPFSMRKFSSPSYTLTQHLGHGQVQAKRLAEVAAQDDIADPIKVADIPRSVKPQGVAQGYDILAGDQHAGRAQVQGAPVGVVSWRQLDGDEDDE